MLNFDNNKKIIYEKMLDNKKVIYQLVKEYLEDGKVYTHGNIVTPYLKDNELLARYSYIKPIVNYNSEYYYLKKYNINMLRNKCFTSNLDNDIRNKIDNDKIVIIDEFPCYHKKNIDEYYKSFLVYSSNVFGNMNTFKPKIADILQQFPDDLLDYADAFYMQNLSETVYDSKMKDDILNAGYHQSVVKALKIRN